MTYRRALKLVLVPWLVAVLAFLWWVASLDLSSDQLGFLGWRAAIVAACALFGTASTLQQMHEILASSGLGRGR